MTSDLILEHLRLLRADLSDVKDAVADCVQQVIWCRKQINGLQADMLRHEEHLARIDVRLDRIDKRVGLVDATH
jgi:hypothetical protein